MGVPGFYSWLTRRYPMIKQMISKESIPQIDYLYLDMNGIIYRCVRDDSIIFKAQLMPKELQEIWIEIFNYINALVDMLKPTKMIVMALDGVAPRCKMNNQRARRFRSAQEYKEFIAKFYGYTDIADSQENFKNNSISPGTAFMNQLNEMLHFFIQKKIEEDNYWKDISIVFTGSDTPGEGEHKIMEFVRSNQAQFHPDDTHCFYGADADLIMLGLTLPVKNACIIRQEYIHASEKVQLMSTRKEKEVNFQLIYLTILKECFDLEYQTIKEKMKIQYDINKIARDFVFLFFFIGNDFLPRIFAYNIREKSIEKLIEGFKDYLMSCQAYITDGDELNLTELLRLLGEVGKFESTFFADKQLEFERLLNKQQQSFEDQLQKLFLTKIKHEEQTLLGLKQMYTNQDASGKSSYYSSYFQIDINTQLNDLWNILAYYVYGLKFVYEYYFKNLASWSWYYPFYFAPLLTDIQYYLGTLIAQGQSLNAFQKGQPFEPFKQLLCILPKESADLLPVNFHKYILEANSLLRNPIDFYPDTVETVNYGSIRAHEAISLIPFLDQSIICQVYEQEIGNIDPNQLKRNVNRPSRLYQYNDKAQKKEVVSPFSTIATFKCNIQIKDVTIYQKCEWKTMKKAHFINEGEEHLLKMPSLFMRTFTMKPYMSHKEQLQFRLSLKEIQNQNFKIGEAIFYGYPLQHSGRIQAVLTKNEFFYTPEIKLDDYDFIYNYFRNMTVNEAKERPTIVFNTIKENIGKSEGSKQTFYNFIELTNSTTFLFLTQTKTFSRTLEGQFQRLFKDNNHESFVIIPACVASRQKKYQTTKTITKFKNLQTEFAINEEVLITHSQKKLCGAKGKVVGYSNDHKKVKVQILEQPRYLQGDLKELLNLLSTKTDIFFSLRFSAQILRMKYDHLQTILGNINVITPRDSKLPPSIDIGLNLFSRREHKIVPNLVRINYEYNYEQKKQNPFKYIELSVRALEILIEYKKKFPEIFKFMQQRHMRLVQKSKMSQKNKIDWQQPIEAQRIYPESPAKNLMKVYKWLVEKEETHMPASSIYSKQVNQKRIQKLKELFIALKNNKEEKLKKHANKIKNKQDKVELLDPNFLFSQKLSQLGYLYLMKKPKNHQIGDLVICVSPQFFGHYGAIVGIDDNKYEVFFDEPSFGKGDLGGLCDNLWGAKFDFRELLNIYTWPALFSERIKGSNQQERLGWNDNVEAFYPKYISKPFQDFQDIKVFTAKQQNKKYFSEQLLEYIFFVQQNLKQVELDQGFTIVDNRKEDHRYKYSKKVAYIEKKQVDEAAQVIKAMEEAPEVLLKSQAVFIKEQQIFKAVKEQIIENRVAEEQKTEGGEIGEEEDAEDILG